MRKVVINRRYGGFGLSEKAVRRYFEILDKPVWVEPHKRFSPSVDVYWTVPPDERVERREGNEWYDMSSDERKEYNELWSLQTFNDRELKRDDPILVQVVEELGDDASDVHAELTVVEIPEDVEWTIQEYDGLEWVAEVHRTWR
jgi:hypothetical protein